LADGAAETIVARIGTRRAVGARDRAADRHERRLIRAAKAGSEEALETLYRNHWPRAHRAAYFVVHDAAAAEDIAQESFLAAIRSLDRFDRRRPFAPWLNRIVVNRAIDWARARALRNEAQIEPETHLEPRSDSEPASGHPYSEEILTALASLSPEHRAVVVLRYLLECTPSEIADMLDLPRGTVNSRLRRALDRLEVQLGGDRS
jgi:RNA polymerase sigma-70 factor (ECF subfamily)